ncbi:unnamed protein product, partial [Vitis vinifera]
MEGDIRAGEHVKKELQQAHIEAQSLVTARQELTTQVQQATQELQKANADVKRLPELHAELDSMGQEHQRLRSTFEYEKGLNVDQVREMQEMEKNLVVMAREVEKLRAEVLNAEKRAHAPNPYSGSYPEPSYPPPTQGSGAYIDSYGRPHAQMIAGTPSAGMIPYGSVAIPPASSVKHTWLTCFAYWGLSILMSSARMVVYPMGWQGSRVKFMFIYLEQSRYGDLLIRAMRSE